MTDPRQNTINYLEIPVQNLAATKDFFANLLGWKFVDYGPEYSCFLGAGIDGGFYLSKTTGFDSSNGPLIVIYYDDLEAIKQKVIALSGRIVKDTFSFPNGRRFHFADINNNEYAVWTDKSD